MRMIRAGVVSLVAIFVIGCSGSSEPVVSKVDVGRVLDITVDEINSYEKRYGEIAKTIGDPDGALIHFSGVLQEAYNAATPPLADKQVAVAAMVDASFIVAEDLNGDGEVQDDEGELWMIEIDGQNARVIATTWQNEVRHAGVPGGFLTGYLIGSLLDRQRVHGNPSAVANKKPRAPLYSARARAGSGSHFRGK